MAKKTMIFNRGSILPSILDIETELAKLELETRDTSDSLVREARDSAIGIIEEAHEEIRRIERDERAKLFEMVDERIEALIHEEERDIEELCRRIDANKDNTVKAILKLIIPSSASDRT